MPSRRRVLHLLASQNFSGAESVATSIILGMSNAWDSIYVSPNGPVASALQSKGVKFRGLSALNREQTQTVLRQFEPDLIHAHDYRASLLASTFSVPTVSHLHNNVPWARTLNPLTIAYLWASRKFRKIIAVSSSVIDQQFFRSRLSLKSVVLPNAVDTASVSNLSLLESPPKSNLVFIGRLTEQKDPFAFIRIVAKLKQTFPSISATMIGEGELEGDCRQVVENLGVQRNISLVGFQQNPYPFLKNSDLCIMPSKWEGFGLVALEAMCLETPILASPVGGLTEILPAVSPECLCQTEEDFVERSVELLGNPEKRLILGKKLRNHVDTNYSFTGYLAEMRTVYENVMEREVVQAN